MAANHYECGELIQQFHLQNCQNDDEIASAGDNLSMELGSQAGIVESHWSFGCNNDIEVKRSFIGTDG